MVFICGAQNHPWFSWGADQNPDAVLWEVLELVFFGIYFLESLHLRCGMMDDVGLAEGLAIGRFWNHPILGVNDWELYELDFTLMIELWWTSGVA